MGWGFPSCTFVSFVVKRFLNTFKPPRTRRSTKENHAEEMLSSSRRPILGEKRNSETIRQEAGALHGSPGFWIAHECVPDKLRAGIFRH